MCGCCSENESLFYRKSDVKNDLDRLELYIESDGSMMISHQNAYTFEQENINLKINYCPMCGRKLVKKK